MKRTLVGALTGFVATAGLGLALMPRSVDAGPPGVPTDAEVTRKLIRVLAQAGFTGRVEETLEARLGRPLNARMADLGRLVFFDPVMSLHDDNSCSACHAPGWGMGDSQSIAIGVDSNGVIGPDRVGPRNQRRAPQVINSAFYPRQMHTSRFEVLSGDPFDNSLGFRFPAPEGTTRFPPNDPLVRTLLVAQAHMPCTELPELAGFTGTAGTISPEFDAFDDGHGTPLPAADGSGYRNEPIRAAVVARLNAVPEYRQRFGRVFTGHGLPPGGIQFSMVARALAEFLTSITMADAPIDRFARGDRTALTASQQRGALLFFGRARCVECHAVAGPSNEMFSDFQDHAIGVPQVAPAFGPGLGNVIFDGPGRDEDFGVEQTTGNPADRYRFRTTPLRNLAVQPAFFHNGAFTQIEQAIHHHLDVVASATSYDPASQGLDPDLRQHLGPIAPVLARLDPVLATPIALSDDEFADLLDFVRLGLLDERALPDNACRMLPLAVPSGKPLGTFQGCRLAPPT